MYTSSFVYHVPLDLSNIYPKPDDVCEFVKKSLYTFEYQNSLPATWDYPEQPPTPPAKTQPEIDPQEKKKKE